MRKNTVRKLSTAITIVIGNGRKQRGRGNTIRFDERLGIIKHVDI